MRERNRFLAATAVAATIAGGSLLTGFAGGSDAGTTKQLDRPPAHMTTPDVDKKDITRPGGEESVYALFRNGKVYKVKAKLKRELVTKADGTMVERLTEGPIDQTGIPPLDPNDKRGPSPAQVDEMYAMTNPGPPDDPANMKAMVAANP